MTATLSEVDEASIESLKTKLDDPAVAESLGAILEHADLLAILVSGLSGLLGRAETMSGALADGVGDVRTLSGNVPTNIDIKALADGVGDLSHVLPKLTPGLAALADAGLIDKLQAPETVAALSAVLDNAELLAVLIQGLGGLISRAELLSGALAEGMVDMKGLVDLKSMISSIDLNAILANIDVMSMLPKDLLPPGLDVPALMGEVNKLASVLPKLTPSLNDIVNTGLIDVVMRSGLTDHSSVSKVGVLAKGIARGLNSPAPQVSGVMSLARHLKDPEISRGLGFALGLLKAIGAELR